MVRKSELFRPQKVEKFSAGKSGTGKFGAELTGTRFSVDDKLIVSALGPYESFCLIMHAKAGNVIVLMNRFPICISHALQWHPPIWQPSPIYHFYELQSCNWDKVVSDERIQMKQKQMPKL